MRDRRWVFAGADRDACARLARAVDISPLTAAVLYNRGVRDVAEARRFLKPELSSLVDPLRFNDMARAVDRLAAAIGNGEGIGIFGDYDVDGTSGTAILVKIFELLGRKAAYRVPHRVTDGYGLNAAAVEAFAKEGVRVLVTIDCGTNDVEEVELARSLGMDVVVVDHHEPAERTAPALAIINPKVKGSTYGFTGICSAGIAFKLAWALGERMGAKRREGFEGFILDAMGLAALGTVADVCPLVGENRVFVRYGLDALRACRGPGLRALLDLARLEGKPIETFDVSFKLAPRLNALGRIGTAMDCVELLVSRDERRIGEILALLERSNRERKGIEDEIAGQAREQVEGAGGPDGAIVVADSRWHLGVVGIVAARLVDRYHRPSFVLAIDAGGVAKGSARSVEGFALHEALEECGDLLLTHGGHAMAAGLSLREENMGAFRIRMSEVARRKLTGDALIPRLQVDEEATVASVTRAVAREFERLAPHGPGNPEPVLVTAHARVAGEPKIMGRRGEHLSFLLAEGGATIRAVAFGMAELAEPLKRARTVSVAFTPQVQEWRGNESVEVHVKDVKFDA